MTDIGGSRAPSRQGNPRYGPGVLLGRHAEEQRLDALLDAARAGRHEALVLVGEAGIGKTALLEHAVQQAEGLLVLRTRGMESEAQLPYAGLHDLCRPLLPLVDLLQPVQAGTLRSALGFQTPCPVTGFAVAAATLSLLAAAAERQPLLLAVDDAHWTDAESMDALAFAVRRLAQDAIGVLVATRPADGRPFLGQGLPELDVEPLDEVSAAELLRRTGRAADRDLMRLAEGNPLALLELQVEEADGTAPVRLSRRLMQAFSARVDDLPAATRHALVLTALAGTAEASVLVAVLQREGCRTEDLEAAEAAGLVLPTGVGWVFRHPLVRSALFHAADPALRRRAHTAVADVLEGTESAGWHRAAAARGVDDVAAAALERTALLAMERAGAAAAATAYERAARLSSSPCDSVRRLAAGADAAFLAGRSSLALSLVDEALARVVGDAERGHLLHCRGTIEHFVGDARAARTLEEAAGFLSASAPVEACLSLTEAVGSLLFAGDVERAVALGEHAMAIADAAAPEQRLLACIPRGASLVVAGRAAEARPFLEMAAQAVRAGLPGEEPRLHTWSALAGWWVGDDEMMVTEGRAAVLWAREHRAPAALPWAAAVLGLGLFRAGRWVQARAALEEGVTAGRLTAQDGHLALVLAPLAWLDACEGRADECHARVREGLALTDALGLTWLGHALLLALVLLELAGTPSDGSVRLRLSLLDTPLREASATSAWPDLIEVLVRRGDVTAAESLLADYTAEADALQDAASCAVAARLRGMLEADPCPHFDRALALHARAPVPFEVARTRLAYGDALRRAGRRVMARDLLRQALADFTQLGATPWAERAGVALRSTGERTARSPAGPLRQMTAQELQIAHLAAQGRTNREVAAQLYLSPKTVEWHLGHVYAKLGVRSRTELVSAMAPGAPSPT